MDIVHDNGFVTWVKLGSDLAELIPSYVEEYTPPDEKAASELPDSLFADTDRRLFPIDSKAAVWLAAAYFTKNAERMAYNPVLRAHVADRIKASADVFGISRDVNALLTALTAEPQEKAAADLDDNYGWIKRSDDGTLLERKYPMFDARGTKLAADYFLANREKYPGEMRTAIAKNILRKSAEFEVPVSATIEQEAGFGIPDTDFVVSELRDRVKLARDADTAAVLESVIDIIQQAPVSELAPLLDKVAGVIEDFDQGANLTARYGKTILTPAEILFSQSVKVAQVQVDDTIVLNKYAFSAQKLAGLEPDIFAEVLGTDFAGRISDSGKVVATKLADELHSLPQPDKRALEQHLITTFNR